MEPSEIEVGREYVYYPPHTGNRDDDNRHFPARVEAVGKRVKVRIFMLGAERGIVRSVSAKRLAVQPDMFTGERNP